MDDVELKRKMSDFVVKVHTGKGQDAKKLLGEIIAEKHGRHLENVLSKDGKDGVLETEAKNL